MTTDKDPMDDSWITQLALDEVAESERASIEAGLTDQDRAELEDVMAIKTLLREELRQERFPGLDRGRITEIHRETVGKLPKLSFNRWLVILGTPSLAAVLGLVLFVNYQNGMGPSVHRSEQGLAVNEVSSDSDEPVPASPALKQPSPKQELADAGVESKRMRNEPAFVEELSVDQRSGELPVVNKPSRDDLAPLATRQFAESASADEIRGRQSIAASGSSVGRGGGQLAPYQPRPVARVKKSSRQNPARLQLAGNSIPRGIQINSVEASGGISAEAVTVGLNNSAVELSSCLSLLTPQTNVRVEVIINRRGGGQFVRSNPKLLDDSCLRSFFGNRKWPPSKAPSGRATVSVTIK